VNEIPEELLARFRAGEPAAITEVISLITERDRNLLERLAVDD
jgi:hypothetical protein